MQRGGTMKHLFKPTIFKHILSLLIVLLLVKLIWFAVEVVWLPTKGITHISKSAGKPLFYRVRLSSNEAVKHIPTTPRPTVTQDNGPKNIKLLAIYNALSNTVVTVQHKGKTKVLQRGDKIEGYMLRNATNQFANFSKNGKIYKILLNTKKLGSSMSRPGLGSHSISPQSKKKSSYKGIVDAGTHKKVSRDLIKKYTRNMSEVNKDISISEVQTQDGIEGFRITSIRSDSPFEQLGLARGDVIKSINGQAINSYEAAFQIYQNMDNIDNLSLVVTRGNEEKELEYEIN